MSKFRDADGREWALRLTIGDLEDVHAQAGFDLGVAIRSEQGLAEMLFTDPATVARVLWVLVAKQAEKAGVSPESFAHALDGPALESAIVALLQAVADFFPRSKIGAALKARLPEMLDRLDNAMIGHLSKPAAGSSPASSESTPAP